MEKDDPAHAVGDGVVGGKEDVTEVTAILLVVLHVDFLETFPHGSLSDAGNMSVAHTAVTTH